MIIEYQPLKDDEMDEMVDGEMVDDEMVDGKL